MENEIFHLSMLLDTPLQSWGYMSRFDKRTTLSYPTLSGIIGMLCASMGIDRKDVVALTMFDELQIRTYVLRYGSRLTDYHTVGGGWDKKVNPENVVPKAKDKPGCNTGDPVQTYREYLQDSCFGVVVTGQRQTITQLGAALENPKWGIWLGRKACIPAKPVFQGIYPDHESALKQLLEAGHSSSFISFIEEVDRFENGSDTIMDRPLDFTKRQFAPRRVIIQQVV